MQHNGSSDQLSALPSSGAPPTPRDRDVTAGLVARPGARRVDGPNVWLVYERRAADEARSRLIFECPAVVRVVRTYPADWRHLSDAELLALSERI